MDNDFEINELYKRGMLTAGQVARRAALPKTEFQAWCQERAACVKGLERLGEMTPEEAAEKHSKLTISDVEWLKIEVVFANDDFADRIRAAFSTWFEFLSEVEG